MAKGENDKLKQKGAYSQDGSRPSCLSQMQKDFLPALTGLLLRVHSFASAPPIFAQDFHTWARSQTFCLREESNPLPDLTRDTEMPKQTLLLTRTDYAQNHNG